MAGMKKVQSTLHLFAMLSHLLFLLGDVSATAQAVDPGSKPAGGTGKNVFRCLVAIFLHASQF